MERFTIFNPNGTGIGSQYGMIQSVIYDCRIGEVIDKLGAYEDTGLTPEEIKNDIRVHTELWEEKIKEIQEKLETEKTYSEYWKEQALKTQKLLQDIKHEYEKYKCESMQRRTNMKALIEVTEQMEIEHALCNEDSDCDGCSCCIGTDDCVFNYVDVEE